MEVDGREEVEVRMEEQVGTQRREGEKEEWGKVKI